jgi:tetratricopeptide (TPR) repeat protein
MTSDVMIRRMNKGTVPFLLLGLLAGFLGMYLLVRGRDLGPLVVRDAGAVPGGTDDAAMVSDLQMIQELQLELQTDPRNVGILSNLANLNLNIQNFSAAIDYFDRALEIAPGNLDLKRSSLRIPSTPRPCSTWVFCEWRSGETAREPSSCGSACWRPTPITLGPRWFGRSSSS